MKIPEEKIPSAVPVAAIRKIEQARNGTLAEAEQQQVKSLADSDVANVILRKLTAGIKLVNERFKEILDPQNEAVRQVRELRSQILTPLQEAKDTLSNKLMGWRAEENRRIAAETAKAEAKERERRALEEKHAANHRDVPGPAPVIEKPVPLAAQDTTKIRKKWDVSIIDKAKVPEEYKTVNEVLLRKDMHAAEKDEDGRPIFEVPGVEVVCEEIPIYA